MRHSSRPKELRIVDLVEVMHIVDIYGEMLDTAHMGCPPPVIIIKARELPAAGDVDFLEDHPPQQVPEMSAGSVKIEQRLS